jgi:hypothetical protein
MLKPGEFGKAEGIDHMLILRACDLGQWCGKGPGVSGRKTSLYPGMQVNDSGSMYK